MCLFVDDEERRFGGGTAVRVRPLDSLRDNKARGGIWEKTLVEEEGGAGR
jgi:hypothetical protein